MNTDISIKQQKYFKLINALRRSILVTRKRADPDSTPQKQVHNFTIHVIKRRIPGPEVIKLLFMVNSIAHELLNAHKYKNFKKFGFCWAQISIEF